MTNREKVEALRDELRAESSRHSNTVADSGFWAGIGQGKDSAASRIDTILAEWSEEAHKTGRGLTCAFCGGDDFDFDGLMYHLTPIRCNGLELMLSNEALSGAV